MRYACRGSLVFSLAAAFASFAAADDLTTLAGKKAAGKLVAIDKQGVVFRTGDLDLRLGGKEVLLVDLGNKAQPPAAKYAEVELTDGSVVRCDRFSIKGKAFDVELPAGGPLAPPKFDLPLASVSNVLRGAEDGKRKDEWRRVLSTRGKRDLYVIRQADGLNFIQGTLIEGGADGVMVKFEKEDGSREDLRLSRATGGLVFAQPAPATPPATLCKVLDVLGNTLVAQAIEYSEAGVKVTTVSGATVTYPQTALIAKFDFSQGNLAYLSDLTAQVDAPELPPEEANKNLGVKAPFLADKAPANEPLKLDGVVYPKGLWAQAGTVLTYTIGGEYREFKAIVGVLDGVADGAAAVRVTIEGDSRPLFSELVRRKDKPKAVVLDVRNVRQLRIIVDTDSPAINGSQAVLGIAQVQK